MKRLLLFVLVALLSLWISLTWFGEGSLHKVVVYLGYPNIFIAFALFLGSFVLLFRRDPYLKSLLPRNIPSLAAIAAVAGLLILYEPFHFQIVYDELILSVSGQLMHFERLCGVPRIGNDYLGSYQMMDTFLDKRPFFFPFLLSLVHDLTGYRYPNVFFLNAVLTLLLVLLVYLTGRAFSGNRGGLLAVLLTGTLPLLAIFATSGHFEILNLVMLCLVVLLGMAYLREPDATRLVPLVFAMLLLAQVRYENAIYLLPFGILILLGWKKAGRILLPWPVIISPVFLIMNAIQFRIIQMAEHGFFQDGPNGRTDTFSLSYIPENLISARNFFFNLSPYQPNSYLLAVFGLAAMAGFLYWAARRYRWLAGADPAGTTAALFVAAIALFSLVILVFNFGLFDRHITARLSLPINLLFILLPPFVLRRLGRSYLCLLLVVGLLCMALSLNAFDRKSLLSTGILLLPVILGFSGGILWLWKRSKGPRTGILAVPLVYILTCAMPISHAHRYSHIYNSNDILISQIRFIEERQLEERMLFISSSPYPAMLTRTNTTFITELQEHPEVAREHLDRKMYHAIYVSRCYERGAEGHFHLCKESEWLDPKVFELERVGTTYLGPNALMAFDRLVNVHLPDAQGN